MFRPGEARPNHVLWGGFFGATYGLGFLFLVQAVAALGWRLPGPLGLPFRFIAFSYQAALDPNSNLLRSLFGFTFGVGLLEELSKAVPLVLLCRWRGKVGWREACLWGLASGAGFGVAEGIAYSHDYYNGVMAGDVYLVRFVSCVALHAMWTAGVGLTLCRYQSLIRRAKVWYAWVVPLLRIVAVAMVLHGLYDTLLKKKDLEPMALAVAVVSFGWFALLIEQARERESAYAGGVSSDLARQCKEPQGASAPTLDAPYGRGIGGM